MNWNPTWICPANDLGDPAAVFGTSFVSERKVSQATLTITALGVYEAKLNGKRVGQFVMAPGWTSYHKRLQYQEYDITDLLAEGTNTIEVTVGKGWYHGRIPGWGGCVYQDELRARPFGFAAQITLTFEDGNTQILYTDESWKVSDGPVRLSEIYDGEIYDATKLPHFDQSVLVFDGPTDTLIPQQGEEVHEQERLAVKNRFVTPKGEIVLDFGQNLTGYVELSVDAKAGDCVDLSFAEVMDKEGNFYTENYRGAKAQYHYICSDGVQTWHPSLTFYGFRYIRINDFPGGIDCVKPENFTAITVHSNMKRTGFLSSSNTLLNQLFSNIIWGQKGNFLDVPTDCPQRDERLGWTGDAQVFVRTACLNYDAEKFFTKWLADLASDQHDDGYVGHVIPDLLQNPHASSAWGDAAAICPWQVYLAFGNKQILKNQYQSMKKWIDYITFTTTTKYLWTGGTHYGDWLGLDAPSGSYKGSSNEDFIASSFYAYSTSLVIQAGTVLGEDVSELSTLYENIVNTFQKTWPTYNTQTECVLAAHFKLAKNCQAAADQLADMVRACGTKLQTGFVGTPYLLHVLSDYGHTDLAWDLLLRTKYPSWLYPVTKGATTIWEHWDGIMEDGNFWSKDMNSYNHYAYGSVADWVYSVAAGILQRKDAPGYAKVTIAPHPDKRLDWLRAELDTRHGHISSFWTKEDDSWRYEITVPVEADIVIDGVCHSVRAGSYCFYSEQKNA